MHDCPKHPNVPPELYNLTDLLIGDLECACEVAQGIMKVEYRGSEVPHLFHGHSYHLEELYPHALHYY